MIMPIAEYLSSALNLDKRSVEQTLSLLNESATIPFIARYRKEQTGGLDEVQLANIARAKEQYEKLSQRKTYILETIISQGQLTPELKKKIETCFDENALEDLYLPYKPKRQTKAEKARQKGLEGLAKIIMAQQNRELYEAARQFVKGEVSSVEDALEGARHIIAEWVSENSKTRDFLRKKLNRSTRLYSAVAKDKTEEGHKYKDYFKYDELLHKMPAHRLLAIARAESEGLLKTKCKSDLQNELIDRLKKFYSKGHNALSEQVAMAAEDAYKRLLFPSLESEMRKQAKEKADQASIQVFAENLRNLLMEPPLGRKRILAIDPGFKTGCKVVCLNSEGELMANDTIFPHPPQKKRVASQSSLEQLISQYKIECIAIGDGTAGKETAQWIKTLQLPDSITPYMVNEDGASVYSASELARQEFPHHDVTVRGAVSIGRRLMDPLAELIKIDPKSLGIGQYQHDVDQKSLKQELNWVVESCVNNVGVELNTASVALLSHVSGLGPKLAQSVIEHRQQKGGFASRAELKKVKGLGPKAFEQAAGFLRIREGKNPLDNTAVHPERYALVKNILAHEGLALKDLGDESKMKRIDWLAYENENVGKATLKDMAKELNKPGRDPREGAEIFQFSEEIRSIQDLREGFELDAVVSNVTNFGVFVDLGIKENGLIHISNLADHYVSNPADEVKLKEVLKVRVIEIDLNRKRIQLKRIV